MTQPPTRLLRAKVVMLGAPSVGKTSLVRRFVHSIFSDEYHSTLGVKVDRKSVNLPGASVAMLLWDVHGETEGLAIPTNYLRAVSAAITVFDASRPETATVAGNLGQRAREASPDAHVFAVANKSDLAIDWGEVDGAAMEAGMAAPARLSAKEDHGVTELFTDVATKLLASASST